MKRILSLQVNSIAERERFRDGYTIGHQHDSDNDSGRALALQQFQMARMGQGMIQIHNATVHTLDSTQARPVGSTVLAVTIGDNTFQMLVDEDELIQALASQHDGTKPCMTPAP